MTKQQLNGKNGNALISFSCDVFNASSVVVFLFVLGVEHCPKYSKGTENITTETSQVYFHFSSFNLFGCLKKGLTLKICKCFVLSIKLGFPLTIYMFGADLSESDICKLH